MESLRVPKPFKYVYMHSPTSQRVLYFLTFGLDLLLVGKDTLIPPCKLRLKVGPFPFIDPRFYRKVGEDFLQHIKDYGALKSNERVLDVGCGCGQMAAQLAKYLDKNAKYEGFDTDGELIEWCKKNISSKYPNFHFQLVNVFNKYYNPKGKYKASEFKFPYENESFDFVFLKSVFTHMLPQDVENYFSEIARVLKKGGRCLITFFLLNRESLNLIGAGKSSLDFRYVFGSYRSTDRKILEAVICYDEEFVLKLYEKYGLEIKRPIHYGSWSGRLNFLNYQDVIIATLI